MKLIKRPRAKEFLFSNKEAQYIAHQLLFSKNNTLEYCWSNNPKRFNKVKGWEDYMSEQSFSTPFRAAMSFLKYQFNDNKRLRKQIQSLKEIIEETEKQKRDIKRQEQEIIKENKEQQLRNAYCGLEY
jgi:hypothetical protein